MSTLKVFRGDDKTFPITITDNGAVKDITGWTVFFTVKKRLSDSDDDAVIAKNITNHTDPTNGKTHIVLDAEDTTSVGNFKADIQVVDDQGKVQTYKVFTFIIEQDVTLRTS